MLLKSQCVFFHFVYCSFLRLSADQKNALNPIVILLEEFFLSTKTIMGKDLLCHMCLKFLSCQKYNFFQTKRIISSQKNILAHRNAIILLTRMWNETNDRTNKEQTHCHTGRMCLRVTAYALLLLRQIMWYINKM